MCVCGNKQAIVSIYFVGVGFLPFTHELMHKTCKCWYTLALCVYLERTHSLGTEFFYREEKDLNATPAEKQTQRVREEKREQKHLSQSCTNLWHLPAHRVSQQENKQAHSSLYLYYSHPVTWIRRVTYLLTLTLNDLSHKHICMLTIVMEWISPMGVHALSLRTHSCAENVAGMTDVRYKNTLCLPGPVYTSHEDISVKNKKRGSQTETYQSYKQNKLLFSPPLLDSPAWKGQEILWLP